MEGIYVGKIKRSRVDKDGADLFFVDHRQDIQYFGNVIDYDETAYCLVPANDIIINNDELLKLRDEVKRLTDECTDWKTRYSKANNELFQKGLAYGTLEGVYKNEKIAGELLLKDRDALKDKVAKLETELTEIKTARNLREAYITGVEKGCESLREERDLWKRRRNSVVTDIGKSLEANGITFALKEINGEGNWDVVIDIPELNEAKKKVDDLEKKLAATKSKETYWQHTFNRAVTQAEQKGVYIGVSGNDEEYNAGVVIVDNGKANELESQVVQMEDANQKLRKRISAADEEIERLKGDNSAKAKAVIRAEYRGDAWMDEHEKLIRKYHELEQRHDAKWSAMTEALKDKGVEVIYMGEQDGKPCVDVKIPGWDDDKKWVNTFTKQCADLRADKFRLERERDELKEQCDILRKDGVLKGQQYLKLKEDLNALKKEHGRVLGEFALCRKQAEEDHKKLEELKSRTLDNVEIRLSCGDIVWTYCDGFVHVGSGISGKITADEIATGTVPKCSSCARYMHNPSRLAHDWCYVPIPEEGGSGYIRKLNKEESEGPACSNFKARKE